MALCRRHELFILSDLAYAELYFGSLGGDGVTMEPAMKLALDANFGSVERWRDEFVAMGKALGGGSGWVLLVFQPREGTLVNQWAADHTHTVAGGVPILALDMYEHAYHMDYGAAAGAYVPRSALPVYQRQHFPESVLGANAPSANVRPTRHMAIMLARPVGSGATRRQTVIGL